jgi:hypothetical protein
VTLLRAQRFGSKVARFAIEQRFQQLVEFLIVHDDASFRQVSKALRVRLLAVRTASALMLVVLPISPEVKPSS